MDVSTGKKNPPSSCLKTHTEPRAREGEKMPIKIFVSLLLSLTAIPSIALADAWTRIGDIEEDFYYVHLESISKSSKTAWVRADLKRGIKVDGVIVKSTREFFEFDCQSMRVRSLELSAFSKSQLKGYIVGRRTTPTHWRVIPPNTPVLKVWAIVCQ
uniref:surface-adhesin E family protein n=1 Tax=Rheinheimera sp. TaxID=1869214 RepID=UPI00404785A1